MAVIDGNSKVCKEIADAFGIKNCSMLNIHLEVGRIVSITAKFYPEEEDLKKLGPILKNYQLVEKTPEKKKSNLPTWSNEAY